MSLPGAASLPAENAGHDPAFKRKLCGRVQEKNKFAISGVEAPGRKGSKAKDYLDILRFHTGSRAGCIGVRM
jgi:hypothetical protein